MKRSEALVNLSRDHHQALVVAMHLKRASDSNRQAVRQEFLDFWAQEGLEHFQLEDEYLLPPFAAHGEQYKTVVEQVTEDHREICERADALAGDADTSTELLVELGTQLADHVRFEERELFPLIEEVVPVEEQEALAAKLQGTHKPNADPHTEKDQ